MRRELPLSPAPLASRLALYRDAWPFFMSLRPLGSYEFKRMLKLGAELRIYVNDMGGTTVLEQGMIQQLWSTIIGHRAFKAAALDSLIQSLAVTAADLIVWVRTSPEEAARRIAARMVGNSRFEKMPPETIAAELRAADSIYGLLMSLYRKHAPSTFLELSGHDPVAENARRVKEAVQALNRTRSILAPYSREAG